MTTELPEFLEREATFLHELAGFDPEVRNCPVALARALGIAVAGVGYAKLPGAGFAVSSADVPTVYVRAVASARRDFAVAHEIAEVQVARAGYDGSDAEELANRFGAAILLPRPCVIAALRSRPWRGLREFAARLRVNPTTAALRLGEATGDPVAVVSRRGVRIRGDLHAWPEPPAQLAKCRRPPSGVYRMRVGSDRVVVGFT